MTSSAGAPKKRGRYVAADSKFNNYKVCRTCGERKRFADFALTGKWKTKRAANPLKYRRDCKVCTRAPSAAQTDPGFKVHRSKKVYLPGRMNDEKRSDRTEYKRRVRREVRVKALEYLARKGCAGCGIRDPRVLEFDHIEPCKKTDNVSRLIGNGHSWGNEKLREEIRKCRVICANCHRIHTIAQQEHYSHDDVRAALRKIYERYSIEE